MEDVKKHLESLTEIKDLMERSTKFISLSGLSGVIAGISALIGAWVVYGRLGQYYGEGSLTIINAHRGSGMIIDRLTMELIGIGLMVLAVSIIAGIILTKRESVKNNQSVWDKNSRLLLTNLLIPLVTGGLFVLVLIYHGWISLIAPVTLLFYGLALVNASKYTLHAVRYLGISEIIIGLLSAVFLNYGIFFWAIGFGVLHIVYGAMMHFKYNRS